MAFQSRSTVRNFALRRNDLNLAKSCSIGIEVCRLLYVACAMLRNGTRFNPSLESQKSACQRIGSPPITAGHSRGAKFCLHPGNLRFRRKQPHDRVVRRRLPPFTIVSFPQSHRHRHLAPTPFFVRCSLDHRQTPNFLTGHVFDHVGISSATAHKTTTRLFESVPKSRPPCDRFISAVAKAPPSITIQYFLKHGQATEA